MQKEITLNRQQQQQFAQRLNFELERMTMSWDTELKQWYSTAIHGLNFASAAQLQIPQAKYIDLFKTESTGINMNIVMVLCNNLELRTPTEMAVTPRDWADTLVLNQKIAERWKALMAPVEKRVYKEFEIMTGKPKMIIAEA